MLTWMAITYNTARLGLEAQNAAAFRLLRMVGGVSKTAADEIARGEITAPSSDDPPSEKVAPKRRHAASKIHKKSARLKKRSKR
jgi:hypothetical protein